MNRPDDPIAMRKLEGAHVGARALLILGGPSGRGWRDLKEELQPDLVIGVNGVNQAVCDLDYWLCTENMTRAHILAGRGDPVSVAIFKMWTTVYPGTVRLISHRSWDLMPDKSNAIRIRRTQYDLPLPSGFTFRTYGEGLAKGWRLRRKNAGVEVCVGTVGLQALHLGALLGCRELHTIGFDLMFRRKEAGHHWYKYPRYTVDRFRKPAMFVEYKGARTQWVWIETAQYLKAIEPQLERDGVAWVDHSDGLLALEGLQCARTEKAL